MLLFFSDIDNTLIYSRRRDIGDKKVCVEWLKGREQGYISQYSYDSLMHLKENPHFSIIPLTTRTEVQYARVSAFFTELGSHYALLCNGGELLLDGQRDANWHRESLAFAKHELEEVMYAVSLLKTSLASEKIHIVHQYFVYAVSDAPETIAQILTSSVDMEKLFIGYDERKVYVLARSISKGNAIRRLQARIEAKNSIAAGDSIFDLSMLNIADIALIPRGFSVEVENPNTIIVEDEVFSDGICRFLL